MPFKPIHMRPLPTPEWQLVAYFKEKYHIDKLEELFAVALRVMYFAGDNDVIDAVNTLRSTPRDTGRTYDLKKGTKPAS